MKLTTIAAGSAALIALSGCAVQAKIDARRDYQKSMAAYQACLAAHPAQTAPCNGAKASMLAARREYEDFTAGLTPGAIGTVNVSR